MNRPSSFTERSNVLKKLAEEKFDVLVIGGGITGAGVLRDAAMRGMKVGLIEQSDFGAGTSSRSSKLVHGGLRYLENMEFGLVSEALSERQNLLEMAPHMVRPLRFFMPVYKEDRVSYSKMGLGLALYDVLSAMDSPELHEPVEPLRIANSFKHLKSDNLVGGYFYSDAYMDDDRLVYETLRSATDHGGVCASYLKAVGYDYEAGTVSVKDQLTGAEFKIKCQHVISCVGPWTDELGGVIDDDWRPKMRPSKGVHITIPKDKLNLKTALVMAADAQSRILFCIPRETYDLIGTTDTDFSGDLSNPKAEASDVKYILNILKEYFPKLSLESTDVISSYAGIRPLIRDGAQSESKVSRDHWIHSDPQKSVTYISGGKYTTYLSMAEACVDQALKTSFPIEKQVEFKAVNTRSPLVAVNTPENNLLALEQSENWESRSWTAEELTGFIERYGAQGIEFMKEFAGSQIAPEQLEAMVSIHYYFCGRLRDFYFRRVPYTLDQSDWGLSKLENIKKIFRYQLKLSDEELEKQVKELKEEIQSQQAWREQAP